MQKKTVVAIHQPNFFPWQGYFNKIEQADIFVFLDNVAISKSGTGGSNSYCKRVQINIQNTAKLIACPIRRAKGIEMIKNVVINDDIPWRKKLSKTIQLNYARAKNFNTYFELLDNLIFYDSQNLAEFNIHAIQSITQCLGYHPQFYRQSDLVTQTSSTELLIEIIKQVRGNTYLCGNGSSGYLNEGLFREHNILLEYQHFKPLPYGNIDSFLPGLSIIDYLMHH